MMEISPLSKVPHFAPLLAFWSYMEWYRNRDINFTTVLKAYKARARNDEVPVAYVCLIDSFPVGMVSLKMDDLWSRKDINPWLASLYVVPEYRNQGAGYGLVSAVTGKARESGFERLFLFLGHTEGLNLEEFYGKRGWRFFDNAVDNDGTSTKIFCYDLQPL